MATMNKVGWSAGGEYIAGAEPVRTGGTPLDSARLGEHLDAMIRTSTNEVEATRRFLQSVRQLSSAQGVWLFETQASGGLHLSEGNDPAQPIPDSAVPGLLALASRAANDRGVQVARSASETPSTAIAVPLFRTDEIPEVLVAVVSLDGRDARLVTGLAQVLQFLAAFAASWRGRWGIEQMQLQARGAFDWLATIDEAFAQDKWADAAACWARRLAADLNGQLVAIGWRRLGGVCRLLGVGPELSFDRHAPIAGALEAVMAETLLLPVDSNDDDTPPTESMRQLAQLSHARHIYRQALRDVDGNVVGACVGLCPQSAVPKELTRWREGAQLAGHQLAIQRHTRRPGWQRAWLEWRKLTPVRQRTMVVVGCLIVCGLLLVPFPYRVRCHCEVQPVTRRFIAAPYEGRLEAALVEPGDIVEVGQPLARMDGHEIRIELAAFQAERDRATKERDGALAQRNAAAAKIAGFEIDRLDAKCQLLEDRLDNLEIKSPTKGVVISGDPKKMQGARLTQGQSLLEVGPLGEMVLEVAIRDEDIAHVAEDALVNFRLDALPHRPFRGRLARIHPRSETRNSENVFIGRVQLEDTTADLRPGMHGRARLCSEYRSLAWIFFHRAWERLLFRIGW